jgi:hypothetical protein
MNYIERAITELVGELGLRIEAVQMASLDERSKASPVFCTPIVTGEERAL